MQISYKLFLLAALSAGVIAFSGCADYVGVSAGYGADYYAPDYRPYYAAYYYNGSPWWGANYYYNTRKIVVRDVDRRINVNRNVYYGGHHFARDWRGGRVTAVRGGPRHG
jgi:hypothetical protein